MKTLVIKSVLSVLTFFLGLTVLVPEVQAQDNTKTYFMNSIRLHGLGNYRGKSLTVYYGLGSRGALSTQSDQITLREVKEKKTFTINSDLVIIPEINLKRSSLFITYNIIILAVHDDATVTWMNGNGTLPDGEQLTNSSPLAVDSLTKIEFDSLKVLQNAGTNPIDYTFGAGVMNDNM